MFVSFSFAPEQVECFTLSKPADKMDEHYMYRNEFYRCLIYFTAALFRNQPGAKYEVLPFDEKMDLVMKWCHKLAAKAPSPKALVSVKRNQSHDVDSK